MFYQNIYKSFLKRGNIFYKFGKRIQFDSFSKSTLSQKLIKFATFGTLTSLILTPTVVFAEKKDHYAHLKGTCLDTEVDPEKLYPDLPIFTKEEVAQHKKVEDHIWVILNGCVYDVTDFLSTHPGGDKILLAKGSSVEPYWLIYPIHYGSPLVLKHLDNMRIGVLCKEDREAFLLEKKKMDENSPFKDDPSRHPALIELQFTPYNGEAPMSLVGEDYITPTDLWFTRQHHPVPNLKDTFRCEVTFSPKIWENMQTSGFTLKSGSLYKNEKLVTESLFQGKFKLSEDNTPSLLISLDDVSALPEIEKDVTIVCAGNRRAEMNTLEKTDGLVWTTGAASTGKFLGGSMAGLWKAVGVDVYDIDTIGATDLIMRGADMPFDASVPTSKALCPVGDVVLATHMNDEVLNRDHGYPLRVVVPGYVGVRNVKWCDKLTLSDSEASSTWQVGAPYKGFATSVKDFKNVNTKEIPSIHSVPVMSVITAPANENQVDVYECPDNIISEMKNHLAADRGGKNSLKNIYGDVSGEGGKIPQCIEVKGWAYSGNGAGIVRVDVTADNAQSWYTAEIEDGPDRKTIESKRAWAWSMWRADVPIPNNNIVDYKSQVEVKVKAVDGTYNVQPEEMKHIWNKRGVLNNSWHSHSYTAIYDDDEDEE